MPKCALCGADNPPSAAACIVCGAALIEEAGSGASHALPLGTKLRGGAYAVGKVLGQGGFGITYLGSDTRLRRAVAIKELFLFGCVRHSNTVVATGTVSPLDFDQAKKRFLQEGQLLARFRHSSIVQVHEIFEENSTAYLVMEYLDGKSLGVLLEERGALPEDEAVGYIVQVGKALAEVHRAGLLHRDIKPDNVIVTERRAVLVDFGAARAFAAGATRRMTAMVTPGYAPLEQYGQRAQFGPYTDVYALGATLYHLLTGEMPPQAPDRAQGVTLRPPYAVNPQVSKQVSDAVMWAMEMKVAQRPQTVDDFVAALVGRRSAPDGGGRDGQQSGVNPYESRIRQVLQELAEPLQPFVSPKRRQADDLRRQVHDAQAVSNVSETLCPACGGAVRRYDGSTTSSQNVCPLCGTPEMVVVALDDNKCPLCQRGAVQLRRLEDWEIFCPVCRKQALAVDIRRRAGLIPDAWLTCERCSAQFDAHSRQKEATLRAVQDDPYGFGQQHLGKRLPLSEWLLLSGRKRTFWQCDRCRCQFDISQDQGLTLVDGGSSPPQRAQKFMGSTFPRATWAKIAAGLEPRSGELTCGCCGAEFDVDVGQKAWQLVRFDEARFPWARAWQKKGMIGVIYWQLRARGKLSGWPGLLCPKCGTEFDQDSRGWKLIRTPCQALAGYKGSVLEWDDWHRLGRGLAYGDLLARLRFESTQLVQQAEQEEAAHAKRYRDRQRRLEVERDRLLEASFVEGYLSLRDTAGRVILAAEESLRWRSLAVQLQCRIRQHQQYWEKPSEGTLLVTDLRVLFESQTGGVWQKPLKALEAVELYSLGGQPLIVLYVEGRQKPFGFAVLGQLTYEVVWDGHSHHAVFDAGTLKLLLERLAQASK